MIGRTNSGVGGGSILGGTAVLTVNAPASVTTTVSKGDKVFTKSSGSTGIVKFGGLSTGTWNVKIDGNGQTRNQNVSITADYSTTIRFFEATINITYPAGSTVTATLGSLVLRAPDTSGSWACVVPNAGNWTITSTLGGQSDKKVVSISSVGQTASVVLAYFRATIHVTYPAGSTCTATDGATTLRAPNTSGSWACVVTNAGNWTVKANDAPGVTIAVVENGKNYDAYPGFLFYFSKQAYQWEGYGVKTTTTAGAQTPQKPNVEKLTDGSVKLTIGISSGSVNQFRGGYRLQNVDLSRINKVRAKLEVTGVVNDNLESGLFIEPPGFTGYKEQAIAFGEPSASGTITIDVDTSNINRTVDVFIPITRWKSSASVTIMEVSMQ